MIKNERHEKNWRKKWIKRKKPCRRMKIPVGYYFTVNSGKFFFQATKNAQTLQPMWIKEWACKRLRVFTYWISFHWRFQFLEQGQTKSVWMYVVFLCVFLCICVVYVKLICPVWMIIVIWNRYQECSGKQRIFTIISNWTSRKFFSYAMLISRCCGWES